MAIGTQMTPRQQEVLSLVSQGLSNREIAVKLGITEDGVKAHLSRLFLRFGATNRIELLAATGTNPLGSRTLTTASLGDMRTIARDMSATADAFAAQPDGPDVARKLVAARDALAAVHAALGLVSELPPETTGPVIDVLRRRLTTAFEALDVAEAALAPR